MTSEASISSNSATKYMNETPAKNAATCDNLIITPASVSNTSGRIVTHARYKNPLMVGNKVNMTRTEVEE